MSNFSDMFLYGKSFTFAYKSANYQSKDNEAILADTTGGQWTLLLPKTPSGTQSGVRVKILDASHNFGTNNLILDIPAGSTATIHGQVAPMYVNNDDAWLECVYNAVADDWVLLTSFIGTKDTTTLISPDKAGFIQATAEDISSWPVAGGLKQKGGWALPDGSEFAKASFPELYDRLGGLSNPWNTGAKQDGLGGNHTAPVDPSTHGRLPDLRSVILRSVGESVRSDGGSGRTISHSSFYDDITAKNGLSATSGTVPTGGSTSHGHAFNFYEWGSGQDGQGLTATTSTIWVGTGANGTGTWRPTIQATDVLGPAEVRKPTLDGADGHNPMIQVAGSDISHTHSAPTITVSNGDTETSPRTTGVYYIIKLYDDAAEVPVNINEATSLKTGVIALNSAFAATDTQHGLINLSSAFAATETKHGLINLSSAFAATETKHGFIPSYHDSGILALPAETWDGTPPTGNIVNSLRWVKVGNKVTVKWHTEYSTSGISNTNMSFTLPSSVPEPSVNFTFDAIISDGSGFLATTRNNHGQGTSLLFQQGGVYKIFTRSASQNIRMALGTLTYFTDE